MFYFFNGTATTEIYTYVHTLTLHDALPIWVEVVDRAVDDDPFGLHPLVGRVGRAGAGDGDLAADRQQVVGEAGALVAPRLAHFHRPDLALGLHGQQTVRVAELCRLDGELGRASGRERVCQYV